LTFFEILINLRFPLIIELFHTIITIILFVISNSEIKFIISGIDIISYLKSILIFKQLTKFVLIDINILITSSVTMLII
jgi:hypothetical protein